MVAVSCKLIRVFYAVLTKGVDYDRLKMMSDISPGRQLYSSLSNKYCKQESVRHQWCCETGMQNI